MNKHLKQLIAYIHPDKFHNYTAFRQINQDALQKILSFWELAHQSEIALPPQSTEVYFYFRNTRNLFEKVSMPLELRGEILTNPQLRYEYAEYCVQSMLYQCGGLAHPPAPPRMLAPREYNEPQVLLQVNPSEELGSLVERLCQVLGCKITVTPRINLNKLKIAFERLTHYAGIFQHLDLSGVELRVGSRYKVVKNAVLMLPYNFKIGKSLRSIEENFPQAIMHLAAQNRQLNIHIARSLRCKGIVGVCSCSITQFYLGLRRLEVYRKILQRFDLSSVFLMIGNEFYVTGTMYYIPYDFDIDELKEHFSFHLKLTRKRFKKTITDSPRPVQLSFVFAA